MAITNAVLGGSDWSDGDVLFHSDLNDTFDAAAKVIHRKQFSDATERSRTNAAGVGDSGTAFTLTAPVGAMILGFIINIDGKATSGNCNVGLKITGTNLGTTYLVRKNFGSADTAAYLDSSGEAYLLVFATSSYVERVSTFLTPLEVKDTSTTLTVRMQASTGGATGYIENVVIDVIYSYAFTED